MPEARLSVLASRVDWQLAFDVARCALERGGGHVVCEGAELGRDQLLPAAAHARAAERLHSDLSSLREQLQPGFAASLQVAWFRLPVKSDDLPEQVDAASVPEIERLLAERVTRYATAFCASTVVLVGNVRAAVWPGVPTLFQELPELISVATPGVDDMDEARQNPVPAERLLELLGDRVERLGDGFILLPGLDSEEDAELRKVINRERVDLSDYLRQHVARQ